MKNLKLQFLRFLALSVLTLTCIPVGSGQPSKIKDIKKSYGLVNVSVCNMRPSAAHNTELISQAVMGTPVEILKKQGNWYYIQTPELYRGWVDNPAIHAMDSMTFEKWKSSERIIYIKKYGDIYDDITFGNVISDIVAGSLVNITGKGNKYWKVKLPDGRMGYLHKSDAVLFEEWVKATVPVGKNLKKCSGSFIGIPYLWGGTSAKAFDCSGFVKTVYYLNGIILERDASQQFRHGIKISRECTPDSLKVGDLLFFGSVKNGKAKATHVGMYIGNNEYIHASGMVKINSFDPASNNFSKRRKNSFLGARRIIGAEKDEGIIPISQHSYYF